MRDNKRVACVLFSGRIEARGLKMTELMAIKAAVEMYIGLNRKAHVPLIIELSSVVVAEWLINRRHRPWSLRNLFENINYGARQMAGF